MASEYRICTVLAEWAYKISTIVDNEPEVWEKKAAVCAYKISTIVDDWFLELLCNACCLRVQNFYYCR